MVVRILMVPPLLSRQRAIRGASKVRGATSSISFDGTVRGSSNEKKEEDVALLSLEARCFFIYPCLNGVSEP